MATQPSFVQAIQRGMYSRESLEHVLGNMKKVNNFLSTLPIMEGSDANVNVYEKGADYPDLSAGELEYNQGIKLVEGETTRLTDGYTKREQAHFATWKVLKKLRSNAERDNYIEKQKRLWSYRMDQVITNAMLYGKPDEKSGALGIFPRYKFSDENVLNGSRPSEFDSTTDDNQYASALLINVAEEQAYLTVPSNFYSSIEASRQQFPMRVYEEEYSEIKPYVSMWMESAKADVAPAQTGYLTHLDTVQLRWETEIGLTILDNRAIKVIKNLPSNQDTDSKVSGKKARDLVYDVDNGSFWDAVSQCFGDDAENYDGSYFIFANPKIIANINRAMHKKSFLTQNERALTSQYEGLAIGVNPAGMLKKVSEMSISEAYVS